MNENQRTGPLAGVRVLDLTTVVMGPSATQLLGDLGADVIKVETPDGDLTRKLGPGSDNGMGAMFLGANRNKRSIVLDLKLQADRDTFLRLIENADVLACNVRPAGMKRLGLTWEKLSGINPRLIYVSMIGFSQAGRYGPSPAFDDLIQAAIGLPSLLAASTLSEPRYVPLNIADRAVGQYAFGVICAALYARERTGVGQHIEVPMFETMVPFLLGDHLWGHKFSPPKGDFGYPRLLSPLRQPFRTRDGYVCCTIYHDHHWREFLRIIGKYSLWETDHRFCSLQVRTQFANDLNELVKSELVNRTTQEWQVLLSEADIPVFPIHTLETLLDDPHLRDIGFFRTEQHPVLGEIVETRVPSEWHGSTLDSYLPPPMLGEHSQEIRDELDGMSSARSKEF